MEKKRIVYIDSLKGISCFLIFLGHYYYGFYAATNQVNQVYLITILFHKFFEFFMNGIFIVAFFCFISGYFVKTKINNIVELFYSILKKYLRLSFPLIFLCVMIWIMNLCTLFTDSITLATQLENPWLFNVGRGRISLLSAIESGFFRILFLGESRFSSQLWMLRPLFIGQILLLIYTYIENKLSAKNVCIYIIYGVFLSFSAIWSYPCLAVLLGGTYKRIENKCKCSSKAAGIVLILLILCGHFKLYFVMQDISFFSATLETEKILQTMIAGGVFWTLSNLSCMKKLLSVNVLVKLGSISFPIYLLHMLVITSIGCHIMMKLYKIIDYGLAYLITESICVGIVLLLSRIWKKTLDPVCNYLSRKVLIYCESFVKRLSI